MKIHAFRQSRKRIRAAWVFVAARLEQACRPPSILTTGQHRSPSEPASSSR